MEYLNDLILTDNYMNSFKRIADLLFNEYKLIIGSNKYEITEIEFYYNDGNKHLDKNIHGHDEQKNSNTWYIHKKGRGGIDITLGNSKHYGGILIRGIKEHNKNGKYIDGPLNVLKEIQKKLNKKNREELRYSLKNKKIDEKTSPIRLERKKNPTKKFIYQGPRVGLVKTDSLVALPYRFIVDINPNHKFVEKSYVYLYTLNLYPHMKNKILDDIGYKFDFEATLNNLENNLKRNEHIIDYLKKEKK